MAPVSLLEGVTANATVPSGHITRIIARHIGAELWSEGGQDFLPTSLCPALGRAGRGDTGRDAE
jgi:hypothetical protein